MLSGRTPKSPISTIAVFSAGFGFSLLYHAPIRIKGIGIFESLEEKGCGAERPQVPRSEATRWFPPAPPVRFCGPRKSSVPGRVQKRSTFMVGCQHRVAHGVVSKDRGLGSISGLERLTNQLSWLSQHKFGFPVPAPSDYGNILSSSNST
jgi:hypothetical protein